LIVLVAVVVVVVVPVVGVVVVASVIVVVVVVVAVAEVAVVVLVMLAHDSMVWLIFCGVKALTLGEALATQARIPTPTPCHSSVWLLTRRS
jgi:hypothetical protein